MNAQGQAIVLYDRDCGFCVWSLAQLLRLDRGRRLRPVALQSPESKQLLGGMDRDEALASAHLVAPDGTINSGGDAVAPILRRLPAGPPLALVARAMTGPLRMGYRWVACNRGLLGRRLSDGAKARAVVRIDRHDGGRPTQPSGCAADIAQTPSSSRRRAIMRWRTKDEDLP